MTNPKPGRTLTELHTALEKRDVLGSVCYCNRCGVCAQSCPTYKLTRQEAFSPRGRNQLMRLVMEQKIDPAQNRRLIEDSVRSCLLCGACTAACAGKIPTAEHMLELRRRLHISLLPGGLQRLLGWRTTRPALFEKTLAFLNFLRRTGVVKLLRKTGVLHLPFLRAGLHADDILPSSITFLQKQLTRQKVDFTPQNPGLIYLPSLEAAYFDPEIGLGTLRFLQDRHPYVLFGYASGLFEYLYGELPLSRRAVKRLVSKLEQIDPSGKLPLLTDSSDVYHFFKNAEQLFAGNRLWARKARKLAARTRFLTDYPAALQLPASPVLLDVSGLLSAEDACYTKAAQVLKTQYKKNFVEYFYGSTAIPPGAYGFVDGGRCQQVLFHKVKDIALPQTGTVVVLSGLCALELQCVLSRWYPHARAQHFARLHR